MFASTMMVQVRIRLSGVHGQRRIVSAARSAIRDDVHLRVRRGAHRVRSAFAGQSPNALNFHAQAFSREFCYETPASCTGLPVYAFRRGYETPCPTSESMTLSNRLKIAVQGILPEEDDDG